MIILTETTDNLQIVLGGAIVANQMRSMACWRDITTSLYTPGRTLALTNNTTDVNIVPGPAASTQRVVDFLSVFNLDTGAQTVTIKLDANGTEYILFRGILDPSERLEYAEGIGFRVLTVQGAQKLSINQGSSPINSSLQTVVLASDVTNNNAVANTIADVTGLSFAVTAGHTYWFQFNIAYTAAATTTGSRWSINGPTFTRLTYRSEYSLAATTTTRNANNISYGLPAGSNATSAQSTLGNYAQIEGMILPSANGTLIARFASEVASSAIVAKAGSMVLYQQLN